MSVPVLQVVRLEFRLLQHPIYPLQMSSQTPFNIESDQEFFRLFGKDDKLPEEGSRVCIKVEGRPMVVLRLGGELRCLDALCFHHGGPLGESGDIEVRVFLSIYMSIYQSICLYVCVCIHVCIYGFCVLCVLVNPLTTLWHFRILGICMYYAARGMDGEFVL